MSRLGQSRASPDPKSMASQGSILSKDSKKKRSRTIKTKEPTLDQNKLAISARSNRPSTNREVNLDSDSVFLIKPEDWNNVPKVIYECCFHLVSEADATRKRNAYL